jgi:Zn-dependent M28 family amino/carboxypeptidase
MQTKRIKKHSISIILTAASLFICLISSGQNTRLTMHRPARNLITEEKISREVRFLSDSICNGRATGTRGGSEAAFWVARQFERIGLMQIDDGWGKSFTAANGATGHNIVGFLPGSSKRHPDTYVVVGAHYDHLGNIDGKLYPGADSNASGVVAMTSAAEMLVTTHSIGKSFSSNILFVAFDGKEMDMAGSSALWDMFVNGSMTDPVSGKRITKDKIAFMVNIDQIGSTLAPIRESRKDYMIMLGNPSIKSAYNDMLKVCNESYDLDLDLGFTYYGSANFTKLFYRLSDQRIFADNKIPAVMFTSGITMNNNKPRDTAETISLEVLRKRIYLIYHWIEKML